LKPMGMVVVVVVLGSLSLFPSPTSVVVSLVRRSGRPDFFFASTLRRRLKNVGRQVEI
jgi:hypothetical protein